MKIEEEIFDGYKADLNKLHEYGFKDRDGKTVYTVRLPKDPFEIEIRYENDQFHGMITDTDTGEEYINYRRENGGSYSSYIRELYTGLLLQIREHCARLERYGSKQAERVLARIEETWQDEPEHLWEKYPANAVFRRRDNQKWYALTGKIPLNKVRKESSSAREVQILNLHADKQRVRELLSREGIYEAWHMNKQTWFTIIFDDVLDDEQIFSLIRESYQSV